MNREILFRGKAVNTNEWIYGSCLLGVNYCGENEVFIYPKTVKIDSRGCAENYAGLLVDSETVSQWTGFEDKNGIKIFEGDIVDMCWYVCGFERYEKVHYYGGGFSPFACPGWECTPDPRDIEVVGNIYDNPELLKEIGE